MFNIPGLPEGDLSFVDVVIYCSEIPELVSNWERLTGEKFHCPPKSVMEALIDDATGLHGYSERGVMAFAAFVYEYVWCGIPRECFYDVRDTKVIVNLSKAKGE